MTDRGTSVLPCQPSPQGCNWEDVARRTWDVLVIGAGPAGAMAALGLARRGASVLLVDKASHPRRKVCGCCLNGLALSVLKAAGLEHLPDQLGARPLRALEIRSARRRARVALPAGVALSRERLDTALTSAAVDAGARYLPETQAEVEPEASAGSGDPRRTRGSGDPRRTRVEAEPDTSNLRRATLRRGESTVQATARIVVVADGLAGQSLRRLDGFEPHMEPHVLIGASAVVQADCEAVPPGTIVMAYGNEGYVGLVRLEDDRLDVAAALHRDAVRDHGGPGPLAEAIVRSCGLTSPTGLAEADWRGTPPLSRTRRKFAAERLFLLGDALGYVQPFTGEGMAWAMLSAHLLEPVLAKAVERWSPQLPRAWEETVARELVPRQRHCRRVARLLALPKLARAVLVTLEYCPWLAAPWVRAVNRPVGA